VDVEEKNWKVDEQLIFCEKDQMEQWDGNDGNCATDCNQTFKIGSA
jgi:hypothetical protein